MLLRLASTIVLVPVAGAAIWFGSPYFEGLVMIVAVLAITEWCRVSLRAGSTVARAETVAWPVLGTIYVIVACLILIWLRLMPDGRALVILFFSIVWATDIGAYLVGRTLGGPKLAPRISPNKTWSGAIGGLIFATLVAGIVAHLSWNHRFAELGGVLILAGFLSIATQVGDLLESWWKRRFQIKDSGHLIPGHGGILDRIDGVLMASIVLGAISWLGGSAVEDAWN